MQIKIADEHKQTTDCLQWCPFCVYIERDHCLVDRHKQTRLIHKTYPTVNARIPTSSRAEVKGALQSHAEHRSTLTEPHGILDITKQRNCVWLVELNPDLLALTARAFNACQRLWASILQQLDFQIMGRMCSPAMP
ncbi:TPA: hypothetical protein ACH3X3_003463 [Trebouxia sp. C0006]